MDYEAEPMQQLIRKAVGRPSTPRLQLLRAEQLANFVRKFAHKSFERGEQNFFPVRKAVGRSR